MRAKPAAGWRAGTTSNAISRPCSRRAASGRPCGYCSPSTPRSPASAKSSASRQSGKSGCNGGARCWKRLRRADPCGPMRSPPPLTAALRDGRLDAVQLEALIDGRERDLDDAPMAGRNGASGLCRECRRHPGRGDGAGGSGRADERCRAAVGAGAGDRMGAYRHSARRRIPCCPRPAAAATVGACHRWRGPAGSAGRARDAGDPGGRRDGGGDGAQSARRRGQNRRTGGSIAGVETGRRSLAEPGSNAAVSTPSPRRIACPLRIF